MGKIIAVASGKGGTGKTTFTANVALALAHMGQRVLCLDCDITLRNLDLALGLSDRALMDFSDVLEGRCTLREAAVPHERTAAELSAFPSGTVHLVVGRVSKKVLRQLHTTIDDAIDAAGLPLLGVIPEDPDVPYCLNRGLVLREQNYYAARAYENIAKRIMGQKTPLMKI